MAVCTPGRLKDLLHKKRMNLDICRCDECVVVGCGKCHCLSNYSYLCADGDHAELQEGEELCFSALVCETYQAHFFAAAKGKANVELSAAQKSALHALMVRVRRGVHAMSLTVPGGSMLVLGQQWR